MERPELNDQRRMYNDLAWTWPLISPKEDYVDEAEEFHRLIEARSCIPVRTMLHLGCGGGHLDYTLKRHYDVTGVDLSESMLALARELNPQVEYRLGDMRDVRLERAFDAVLIADSIDYMLTADDLQAAFVTAWVHLRPGGVFCTYAEVTREGFVQNKTDCSVHSDGDVEIAFLENMYDVDPTDTVYENVFVYVIRSQGKLRIETDRHLAGLFGTETWHDLLNVVGFQVKMIELAGIPTFVAAKPLGRASAQARGADDARERTQ